MRESSETKSSNGSFSTNPLDVQMQQAWEQVNAGNPKAAADLFRGALTLADSYLDVASVERAKVMTDVSSGLFLLGEPYYEESTNLLSQAIEILSAAEGELNIGCGRLHRQLAVMYNARNDFESGANSLSKAIDVFEALEAFGFEVDSDEKNLLYKEIAIARRKADEARGPEDGEPASSRLHHCDDSYH